MVSEPTWDVCMTDGVPVGQSRSGRLVHLQALPKSVDPDHEIVPVEERAYRKLREVRTDLKAAAEDMLVHHASLHPVDGCEWADRLRTAARLT